MSTPDWNILLPALRPGARVALHAPTAQALARMQQDGWIYIRS